MGLCETYLIRSDHSCLTKLWILQDNKVIRLITHTDSLVSVIIIIVNEIREYGTDPSKHNGVQQLSVQTDLLTMQLLEYHTPSWQGWHFLPWKILFPASLYSQFCWPCWSKDTPTNIMHKYAWAGNINLFFIITPAILLKYFFTEN